MDDELRALERAQDDPAAAAAFLRAQVRAGRLGARRLVAAACLGNEPAIDAVGLGFIEAVEQHPDVLFMALRLLTRRELFAFANELNDASGAARAIKEARASVLEAFEKMTTMEPWLNIFNVYAQVTHAIHASIAQDGLMTIPFVYRRLCRYLLGKVDLP